jgi:hypothetical protein
MTRVRPGSVVLLILGLIVIIALVTYATSPPLAIQLGMLGTGLVMVAIALATIRIREI